MRPSIKALVLIEHLLLLGYFRRLCPVRLAHLFILFVEDGILESILNLLGGLSIPCHWEKIVNSKVNSVALNLLAFFLLILERLKPSSTVSHVP